MARTFRRKQQAHPIAELNITNLVDLGFTLLVIFMVAASVIKEEKSIPVNLPSSASAPQKAPDQKDVTKAISVDAQGRFYLEEKPTAVSLAELRTNLRTWAAMAKPPIIRIRGDNDASWGKVYQVVDECKRLNLTRLNLDSQLAPR